MASVERVRELFDGRQWMAFGSDEAPSDDERLEEAPE